MARKNRRRFLKISAAAAIMTGLPTGLNARADAGTDAGSSLAPSASRGASHPAADRTRKPLRLGIIVHIKKDPESVIRKVYDLGLPTCQVGVESFEPRVVDSLRAALDR